MAEHTTQEVVDAIVAAYELRQQAIISDLLEACTEALNYRKQTHHGNDKCIALLEKAIEKATYNK